MDEQLKPYTGAVKPASSGTPNFRPYTGSVSAQNQPGNTQPSPEPQKPQEEPSRTSQTRSDRVAPAYDASLPFPDEMGAALRGEDYKAQRPREGFDIELPLPNMSMYDDLGTGDAALRLAQERYQLYATHPEATRGVMGEIIYKNRVVPPPWGGLFDNPDPSPLSTVTGIGRNVAKNVLETGLAVGDFLESKMPLGGVQFVNEQGEFDPAYLSPEEYRQSQQEGRDALSLVSDNVAELDAGEGIVDNIFLEGGQLIAGGTGGLKVADKFGRLLPKFFENKYLSRLGRALGFEVGAASALSDDVQTILIGENAIFGGLQESIPLLKGVQVPPDSPEYEQILGKRLNILMDAAALAKPAESVMKGATWTANFAYSSLLAPLLQAGSRSKQEEALVREILDKLASTTNASSDEQLLAVRDEIVGLIRNNQDVFIRAEDDVIGDIEFATDTMTALERALEAEDTPLARQIITQARTMRSGAMNMQGGAPRLTETVGAPSREFEGATRRVEQGAGGSEAIEGARQGIVESANREAAQFDAVSAELRGRLNDAEGAVVNLLRNDPTFGAQLDQLSRASGIDFFSARNQASDQIVDNVRQAFLRMDGEKNARYSAIKGGEVDPEGMLDVLQQLQPGQLDAAAGAMPANSQFGAMLNAARRQAVEVPGAGGQTSVRPESDEELLERFTNWVNENNLDFSKLYRDIRPSVSSTAENLYTAAAPEARAAGQVLRDFANWIDNDAIDFVIDSGDQEVADAAMEAKRYYVQEYAPFWRDGVLGEVADVYRATVGRTSEAMRRDFGTEVQPLNFTAQTRQRLEGVLSDTNREFGTQVIRLLGRPEAGQNASLVTDYIIGDVTGNLGVTMRSGTPLDQVELNQIVSRLSNYGSLISKNFPEEAARINGFINNLRMSKTAAGATREALDQAQVAAREAKQRIYDQELGAFFQRQGVPYPNGYAVFEGLYRNNQSADVLRGLMDRAVAENNPIIIDGMQAAYARFVRERFLGAGQDLGGGRPFSVAQERKLAEDVTPLLEYGDIVFRDRPQVMEATRELLDLAGFVERNKRARSSASDSATAARTQAIEAANRTITLTFGVLSRLGARVRATATNIINRLSPDEAAFRILDAVYADPDEFVRIAERVQKADRRLNPDTRDAIFTFLTRAGIYNEEDRQEFLPAMAQAELEYREARNQVRDQMNELFDPSQPGYLRQQR